MGTGARRCWEITGRGRLGRVPITVAMGCILATLSIALLGVGGSAIAAEGSITIRRATGGEGSYDAFCLFVADLADDGSATHLSWGSEAVREVVLPVLDDAGYPEWLQAEHPEAGQRELAQNAAEYLGIAMGAPYETEPVSDEGEPSDAAGSPTSAAQAGRGVQGRRLAIRLARALSAEPSIEPQLAHAGVPFTGDQGLWLFVRTRGDAVASDEAGTTPLLVTLGATEVTVTEKSDIPTLTLEICEDSSETWGRVADANVGQPLECRAIATFPSNLPDYERYHARVTIRIPAGQQVVIPDGGTIAQAIHVSVQGKEVPVDGGLLTVSLEQGVLTVDAANLRDRAWDNYDLAGGQMEVAFRLALDPSCTVGQAGNRAEALLSYTNDPVTLEEGATKPSSIKTFTYVLQLCKVDAQTEKALPGAGFSLRVSEENSDTASRKRCVQQDGSLGEREAILLTGDDGMLTLKGVDEGTYVIHEATIPSGYQGLSGDVTVTLGSELDDQQLSLSRITATTQGDQATVSTVDGEGGLLRVRIENTPQDPGSPTSRRQGGERLPQTGVGPVAELLLGASMLVGGIAGASMIARRRR